MCLMAALEGMNSFVAAVQSECAEAMSELEEYPILLDRVSDVMTYMRTTYNAAMHGGFQVPLILAVRVWQAASVNCYRLQIQHRIGHVCQYGDLAALKIVNCDPLHLERHMREEHRHHRSRLNGYPRLGVSQSSMEDLE
jgi:hypothetical protein